MDIRRLGKHGLAVSDLSLGTLTWGRDTDDLEASDLLQRYLELGGTTLDVPSDWGSATFDGRIQAVGGVLEASGAREALSLVLHSGTLPEPHNATAGAPVGRLGPRTSKRNLLASLDAALKALRTDRVDLWVIHGPLLGIGLEEIRDAAVAALDQGKALYVGAADLDAWDYGALASSPGSLFSALAGPFSLLDAGRGSLMLKHGSRAGLGFVALSPLAQGVLTGKYRTSTPPDSRAATGHLSSLVLPYLGHRQNRVVEAVARAAEGLETTPAKLALAWVLSQPYVSTAVIGPRNLRQLDQLVDGGFAPLPREVRDVLTEVSLS